MTIDDKIKDEKLQYYFKRAAADYQHYDQLKWINLHINNKNMETIEKQLKIIEEDGKKEVEALEV